MKSSAMNVNALQCTEVDNGDADGELIDPGSL